MPSTSLALNEFRVFSAGLSKFCWGGEGKGLIPQSEECWSYKEGRSEVVLKGGKRSSMLAVGLCSQLLACSIQALDFVLLFLLFDYILQEKY